VLERQAQNTHEPCMGVPTITACSGVSVVARQTFYLIDHFQSEGGKPTKWGAGGDLFAALNEPVYQT